MPLVQGKSDEAVSENIRREMRAGKPQRQAIAIAMRTAGRPKKTAAELVAEIAASPAKLAAFAAVKAAMLGKEAGIAARTLGGGAVGGVAGALANPDDRVRGAGYGAGAGALASNVAVPAAALAAEHLAPALAQLGTPGLALGATGLLGGALAAPAVAGTLAGRSAKTAGIADLFGRMAAPALGGAALGAGAGALSAKMNDRNVGRGALAGGLGGGALGALGGALSPSMAGKGNAYAQAASSGLDANSFKGMASKMLEGAGMAVGAGAAGMAGNALLGSVDTRESRDKELGKFEAQQEIKGKQLLALEPQHNAAFTAAKTDDVIAKADTALVHSSFATMKRFAPNLAADPNAVRSFLREAVIYGNGPSYATLKNLADAEKSVVGAGGVGR